MDTSQRRLLHIAGILGATAVAAYGISKVFSRTTPSSSDNYPINVGSYSWKHVTTSSICQLWCDRGWVWVHGFHRQEASDCFQTAIQHDPNCAMAHYGLALVNGPDYNFTAKGGFYTLAAKKSGYPSLNVAVNALKQALNITDASKNWTGPPQYRALIEALCERYEYPVKDTTANKQIEYRNAMRKVAKKYPNIPEIQAIYAESVMCLSPWKLYDNQTTNPTPNIYGQECKIALDRGLTASPSHFWLCHLKTHYCEMGKVEDFDWDAANALRYSETHEIGHLLHMPTHLDIQSGDYKNAIDWNIKGYNADLKLIQAFPDKNLVLYVGYLVHNMEFCAWAAMYGGNYAKAMAAIDGIDTIVSDDILVSSDRSAQRMELYRSTRIMCLIRFGKWDEILNDLEFMQDKKTFLSHTLFLHYGRGIAFSALGQIVEAKQEQELFLQMLSTLKIDDRIKHNVEIVEMANIARDILDAEIKYRENKYEQAFVLLTNAIQLFTDLPYDEPHGWLMSPRHTLGALLTEQKQYERAVAVYECDLIQFPNNPWSLSGVSFVLLSTSCSFLETLTSLFFLFFFFNQSYKYVTTI